MNTCTCGARSKFHHRDCDRFIPYRDYSLYQSKLYGTTFVFNDDTVWKVKNGKPFVFRYKGEFSSQKDTKMKSQQELAANEETRQHIDKVRKYLRVVAVELLKRGEVHDQSKLGEVEAPTFAIYTDRLKNMTYGSDEYNKCREEMKVALDHHYAKNRHHPEHHKDGINDMTLVDLVEMFCDWFASSQRHADGNILKSIEHNKERFGMNEQLAKILENTAKQFDAEV